ncbi:helix-turn-helix domain-containing protein [Nakamurella lactea]|uniref:helix-turn-helix domain-containing protein n=1 Tax=Nakamurella lactea TaxID=459515 RepID=UPI00040B7A60|nr:XRE family transcriptional regulator [Nakamurella lactea]
MPDTDGEPAARAAALVGAALRKRRLELGLTLTALAGRSALSTGFISQIETGAANPTLSALSQLAGALELPVTELLTVGGAGAALSGEFPLKVRPAPLPAPAGAAGRVWELTAPGARLARLSMVQGDPGDHAAPIRHPGEEICIVLAGQYRLHVEGDTAVLAAGDSAHYSASAGHYLEPVDGTARAMIMMVGQ